MTKPIHLYGYEKLVHWLCIKKRFIFTVFAVNNLKLFFFNLLFKKWGPKAQVIISAGRCQLPLIQNVSSAQSGGSIFSGGVESLLLLRTLQMVKSPRSEKTTAMTKK